MRRTLGRLGLAIGAVIVAGGVFGYVSTRRFIDRAARAAGAVVRVDPEEDTGDGGIAFRPVVRFRTAPGATVEFKSRLKSNPAAYAPGDAVAVLYEPDAPDRAEIDGFWSLWSLPLLCGVIGSAFLAVGAVVLLAPRSQGATPPGT